MGHDPIKSGTLRLVFGMLQLIRPNRPLPETAPTELPGLSAPRRPPESTARRPGTKASAGRTGGQRGTRLGSVGDRSKKWHVHAFVL